MKKIIIENFRCFRERQEARLAPLTLLVGENSTGKTSFMALIRILWDVAFSQMIPDFKEEPYDLGSFDEVVHHRGKGGRAEQFKAGFNLEKIIGQTAFPEYCLEVAFGKKGTVPTPVHMTLSSERTKLEMDRGGKEQSILRLGISLGKDKTKPIVREIHFDVTHGLLAHVGSERGLLRYLSILLVIGMEGENLKTGDSLTVEEWEEIKSFVLEFQAYHGLTESRPSASAPVRSKPQRTYDRARLTRDSKGIPMYLSSMHSQGGREWKYLKSALEKFGVAAGLFDEIAVRT